MEDPCGAEARQREAEEGEEDGHRRAAAEDGVDVQALSAGVRGWGWGWSWGWVKMTGQ